MTPSKCRSVDCHEPPAEDDRWCAPHRVILDRVKAEIEAGKAERLRSSGTRRRRTVWKRCEWFDCPDAAKPGARHCLHHLRLQGAL